jgi:hypothetical protein
MQFANWLEEPLDFAATKTAAFLATDNPPYF